MYKCLCPITEKMYIMVQLYVHTRLLCAAGLYENWFRVSKPILKISHTLMRTQTRLLDKLDCVWTVSLCVNDCGVSKGHNIELLPLYVNNKVRWSIFFKNMQTFSRLTFVTIFKLCIPEYDLFTNVAYSCPFAFSKHQQK